MKKIVKLTESDLVNIVKKVINEQLVNVVDTPKEIKQIQQKLVNLGYDLGPSGPNKDGVDGYIGRRTRKAIKDFQTKNNIKSTGVLDQTTQNALSLKIGINRQFNPNIIAKDNTNLVKPIDKSLGNQTLKLGKPSSTKPKAPVATKNNRCIAISKEECAKISSSKETVVSTGAETRCSAYMVKCLSQYNSELYGANAWNVFNTVKGNGQVKYNAYTDGSVNWNNIYSQIKQSKIGKNICNKYAKSDDADKVVNSNLPNIVTNSIPQTTKINISSLELGDLVGLYHKDSANKGMAFCQRALTRNLDDNGNMEKDPFTFNSHVGFVGAIKDGVPIVIHNIHGSHTATPATKMLNKNDKDMIVWVVGDNEVKSAVNKNNSGEEKKSSSSGWDFFN